MWKTMPDFAGLEGRDGPVPDGLGVPVIANPRDKILEFLRFPVCGKGFSPDGPVPGEMGVPVIARSWYKRLESLRFLLCKEGFLRNGPVYRVGWVFP